MTLNRVGAQNRMAKEQSPDSPQGVSPTDDPFQEFHDLVQVVFKAVRSQAFSPQQQRALLQPAIRTLRELRKRAEHLRDEHEHAVAVEKQKAAIFQACAVLGEASEPYLAGLASMGFKEAVGYLKSKLIDLKREQLERRSRVGDLIDAINGIRLELGDPPVARNEMLRPADSVKTAESEDLTALHVESTTPHLDAGSGGLGMIEDLSEDALAAWNERLKRARKLREGRIKVVKQLAMDIMALWKEDSRVPSLTDADLSDIDRKILTFSKSGYTQAATLIGLGSAALDGLAQRKHDLVVCKQDRIRTTLEITKRLRLIEDRIVLINLMNRVEAQAANPLRLFGDSTRLQQEDRFRRVAYPRLLLIEATLRPALLVYKARHGQPFRYKGVDYLAVMDEELQTRTVPRGVFGCTAADLAVATMTAEEVEDWFGAAGDDGNYYKGLSDTLVKVLDATQPDFAKVLALSSRVDDVMAERIAQKSEADLRWMDGALGARAEKEIKSDELKLLELGWRLPTTSANSHVRKAAAQQLGTVVPVARKYETPEDLRQRFFRKAETLGAMDGAGVNEGPSGSIMARLAYVGGDGRSRTGAARTASASPRRPNGAALPLGLVPPSFTPRQRREPSKPVPVGPSGKHAPATARTATSLHEEQESLTPVPQSPAQQPSLEHHGNHIPLRRKSPAADVVGPAQLVARPPTVMIDPHKCTNEHHTSHGTCGDCRARSVAQQALSLPSSRFAEPDEPRMLDAGTLVPRCLPPSDVKRLRVTATQIENIRRPRHVPLSQQPAAVELQARRDAAYKAAPRPNYRAAAEAADKDRLKAAAAV
jgi:hypothetical protein